MNVTSGCTADMTPVPTDQAQRPDPAQFVVVLDDCGGVRVVCALSVPALRAASQARVQPAAASATRGVGSVLGPELRVLEPVLQVAHTGVADAHRATTVAASSSPHTPPAPPPPPPPPPPAPTYPYAQPQTNPYRTAASAVAAAAAAAHSRQPTRAPPPAPSNLHRAAASAAAAAASPDLPVCPTARSASAAATTANIRIRTTPMNSNYIPQW